MSDLIQQMLESQRPEVRKMPLDRLAVCHLLDKGMSHEDIRRIPNPVMADYLMMMEAGVVGPLAECKRFHLLATCMGAKKSSGPLTIRDTFPELETFFNLG